MTKELSPLYLAFIAGAGMFLSTLDSGIINVAIPELLRIFSSKMNAVIWTVTLYTLLLSATVLLFGKLADRWGRLRLYRWGLCTFALSSLLCGAAGSMTWLIVFRGLQGLSAAMLQATAMALITSRVTGVALNRAMGVFGLLLGLGAMLGPVIGGLLISLVGWRWIFWINLPICMLALLGCRQLATTCERLKAQPIHYINLILLDSSVLLLLLSLNLSLLSLNQKLLLSLATVLLFSIYVISEYRSQFPVIPLRLFSRICFVAPMMHVIAFGGATSVAFMLPPLFLENLRGLSSWHVGLICLASSLGIVLIAQLAAHVVRSYGTVLPMTLGIMLMIASLLGLAQMQLDWQVIWIFVLLLVYGIGGGLVQTPAYTHITQQFAASEQAFVSALIRMLQNLSIAVFAALVALFLQGQTSMNEQQLLRGIQWGWYLVAGLCGLTFIVMVIYLCKRNKVPERLSCH